MSRTRLLVAILVALLSAGALATGAEAGDPNAITSSPPSTQSLGYGFGASLDQPFQVVGSQAIASLFFFNLSRQDAFGSWVPFGGEGCSFFVNILDDKERLVRRPRAICPMLLDMSGAMDPNRTPPSTSGDEVVMPAVIGPFPFPAGTFRRFDVPLPLTYASSQTGDPNGAPLPGGLYTLTAKQLFNGPGPGGNSFGFPVFPGGDPEARVPFRIYQCTAPAGLLPVRELVRGYFSGYRNNDPTFFGEDLVLRTGGAGPQFWQQHTSLFTPPPDPPAVDLSQETVLVSLLGPRPSSGFSVRILSVLDKPCQIEVIVQEGGPPLMNVLPVITTPFDFVAIPRSLKEVVFVHQRVSTDGIEATVGQDFAIILDSNATTGFRWQLAQPLDDTILTLVGSEFRPPATPLAGAPGEEVWTFRAIGRGATTISLKYVRPWETGVPPARTVSFPVVVQ